MLKTVHFFLRRKLRTYKPEQADQFAVEALASADEDNGVEPEQADHFAVEALASAVEARGGHGDPEQAGHSVVEALASAVVSPAVHSAIRFL